MRAWRHGFLRLEFDDRVVICTIARGEILFGLERLAPGRRRTEIEGKARKLFAALPCEAIPPAAGNVYANIKVSQQRRGLPLDENDLWMAATALALSAPTANPSACSSNPTLTPTRPRPQNEPAHLKMRSLRQPGRAEPKATFIRCLRVSASPRQNHTLGFPHSTTGSSVPSNPRCSHQPLAAVGYHKQVKMRPLRQPDRAEPKATFLRCLRVSASPRQNHTLAFPHSTTGSSVPSNPSYSPSTTCRSRLS